MPAELVWDALRCPGWEAKGRVGDEHAARDQPHAEPAEQQRSPGPAPAGTCRSPTANATESRPETTKLLI